MKWLREVGWRYAVVLLVCAFALFPVVFVVSAAINPLGTLGSTGLIPEGASLSNFHDLLTGDHPFAQWFLNSVVIALISAFAGLLISVAAAYAFSRMRFRGRRVGLLSILLIQMFPQFLAIVAIFIVFTDVTELYPAFGFNRPWGLLILYLGGALGVNTYLMKGYLDTVPKEIDESATMDGASHVQTFFRIILPLVGPVLAVTAMLSFIGTINEFLIANVFLRDTEAKTLAVGMYGMLTDKRDANFGMFAAATLLTAIPTVSLFLWLQKYIVSGLTAGAVKG
ncbi:sugar ABC transporter permease [Catellatospora methionotrophica]|uniref:Sugar ABC transporter permease n=1 Tax=Catellatospora methionotrophica TaxID=121620 RepID=A0A8J3PGA0_9ACTN|nr:sugar ABC transporter permease [Catellatospora methionotrophica]GIG16067.1 sugar ABC transporter permease [Catellatospora methionotrophica]